VKLKLGSYIQEAEKTSEPLSFQDIPQSPLELFGKNFACSFNSLIMVIIIIINVQQNLNNLAISRRS
jgi:hypothetical protein